MSEEMDIEEKFEKGDFNILFTMENVYVKVVKTFQGEIVANEFIPLKKSNNFSLIFDSPAAVEITMFGVLIKVTNKEGVSLITELLTNGRAQPNPTKPFSPAISSPKQQRKFRGWEAIGKSRIGIIYKEVVNRILEEYKKGVEPETEIFSRVIREMYGEHLTKSSIATYISTYRVYIRDNKLAIKPKPPQEEDSVVKQFKQKTDHQGEDLKPLRKKIEKEWNAITSIDSTPIMGVILEKLKPLFLEEKNNPGIPKIERVIYEAYNGSITKSRATEYAYNYLAYIKKELRKENPEEGVYKDLPDEFWHRKGDK